MHSSISTESIVIILIFVTVQHHHIVHLNSVDMPDIDTSVVINAAPGTVWTKLLDFSRAQLAAHPPPASDAQTLVQSIQRGILS